VKVKITEVTVEKATDTHDIPSGEPNSDPVGLIPLTGGGGDRYVLKPMYYPDVVYQRSKHNGRNNSGSVDGQNEI
jgi:hypothetical protein